MEASLVRMEGVFRALGDSTRLRILGLLLTGEVCVCHINAALKISQPKASRHLAYLRRARLVEARRDGTWMHYRLAPMGDTTLAALQAAVTDALRQHAEVHKDLARLQRLTGCCLPSDQNGSARSERGNASVARRRRAE